MMTERDEKIWGLFPAALRAEFAQAVEEAMAGSDYEGLGAPYDEDAEGVAQFIAVRAGAFVAQLMDREEKA